METQTMTVNIPAELFMQADLGISQIPHPVFVVVHVAILVVAVALALQTSKRDGPKQWITAFSLVALAEILYILYHIGITHFLLSHTLAEVLILVAIILFFVGWTKTR